MIPHADDIRESREALSMNTLEKWLTHNPHLPLKRVPSEWDGCAFWQVDTSIGRHLVLAPDEDYAERAVLRYFGEANRPTAIEGPLAFPMLSLAGWAQYLDAVMVLEGDPAKSAMRAPDSSAALDTDLAFMDALKSPCEQVLASNGDWRRSMRMSDRWGWMHERRIRHLTSSGAIGDVGEDSEWDGERWRL